MKKKLTKRNKNKFSQLLCKYGYLFRLVYRTKTEDYINKYKYRYIKTENFENASIMLDDWISVPISFSSRNKKSRVQNRVISYKLVFGIADFNKEYGTDLVLSDIPVK